MTSQYLLDFSKFVSENFVNYEVEHALNEIVETVEVSGYIFISASVIFIFISRCLLAVDHGLQQ